MKAEHGKVFDGLPGRKMNGTEFSVRIFKETVDQILQKNLILRRRKHIGKIFLEVEQKVVERFQQFVAQFERRRSQFQTQNDLRMRLQGVNRLKQKFAVGRGFFGNFLVVEDENGADVFPARRRHLTPESRKSSTERGCR